MNHSTQTSPLEPAANGIPAEGLGGPTVKAESISADSSNPFAPQSMGPSNERGPGAERAPGAARTLSNAPGQPTPEPLPSISEALGRLPPLTTGPQNGDLRYPGPSNGLSRVISSTVDVPSTQPISSSHPNAAPIKPQSSRSETFNQACSTHQIQPRPQSLASPSSSLPVRRESLPRYQNEFASGHSHSHVVPESTPSGFMPYPSNSVHHATQFTPALSQQNSSGSVIEYTSPISSRLPPFASVAAGTPLTPRSSDPRCTTPPQSHQSFGGTLSTGRSWKESAPPTLGASKRLWSDRESHQHAIRRNLEIFDFGGIMDDLVRSSTNLVAFGQSFRNECFESQFRSGTRAKFPTLKECDEMLQYATSVTQSLMLVREQHLMQPVAHEPPPPPPYQGPDSIPNIAMESRTQPGSAIPNPASDLIKKRRGRAAPPGRCHSCNRAETPEWRRGPDGARTLCNACGLHYAKLSRKNVGKNVQDPSSLQSKTEPDDTAVD